ncbi:hypothetical protein J7E50_11915 [Pedobacter sp. ISL-68]|uniref:hypothetical protein n=1 Tax=unclassified Pedobacter TaxID=2628915 RepID=UPI001BED286F|nr:MULTISPECIES: hypothetical protein [unclassified Pedobacter]MBT2561542.1 hypothetical protein [Pedobacter sp. ISL-64]MBT2590931.1 hypothetical protein [Pedobacter sp. ISL-68]
MEKILIRRSKKPVLWIALLFFLIALFMFIVLSSHQLSDAIQLLIVLSVLLLPLIIILLYNLWPEIIITPDRIKVKKQLSYVFYQWDDIIRYGTYSIESKSTGGDAGDMTNLIFFIYFRNWSKTFDITTYNFDKPHNAIIDLMNRFKFAEIEMNSNT